MRGILVEKDENGYRAALKTIDEAGLPEGEVTVKVQWSSLNYKDGLAITGKAPVVRKFPMVPGIDLAGIVEESRDPRFKAGDAVLLNSWGVGETHWGGYAEKARLKADWLLPLPQGLSARQAMAIGTAGYTAMLCVLALEHGDVTPDKGEIVVTGAAGGVGSVAIALLSKLGYTVAAVSGRPETEAYLKELGATSVLPRSEFSAPGKPLAKERWAGAVDVVGSHTLANICASIKYGGVVAACGLAGGMDLPATVAPFILRGVTLAGIDAVMRPVAQRHIAWQRLTQDLDLKKLDAMTREISLDEVLSAGAEVLAGQVRGRTVVKIAD